MESKEDEKMRIMRAIMEDDLGITRRANLVLEGDDNRRDVDLKKLDSSRKANDPRSEEGRLAKKNEAGINAWTNFHLTQEDDERDKEAEAMPLESDMGFGQSYRTQMQENLRIRTELEKRKSGSSRGGSSRRGGRGGGAIGRQAARTTPYSRPEKKETHQATNSSSRYGDDMPKELISSVNDLHLGSPGSSKKRNSTPGSRSGDEKPTKFNPFVFGRRPVSEKHLNSQFARPVSLKHTPVPADDKSLSTLPPRPGGPKTNPTMGQKQASIQINGHQPFIMPPRPGGPKKVSTVGLINAHIQKNDYPSVNMPPRPGGLKTNFIVGQKQAPIQIDGHQPFIMPPRPGGPKKVSTIGQNHSQGFEERKDPNVKSGPKETRSDFDVAQPWNRGQDPRDKPAARSNHRDDEAAHGNSVESKIRSNSRKGGSSSRTSSSSDRIGKADATPSRRPWPMSTDPAFLAKLDDTTAWEATATQNLKMFEASHVQTTATPQGLTGLPPSVSATKAGDQNHVYNIESLLHLKNEAERSEESRKRDGSAVGTVGAVGMLIDLKEETGGVGLLIDLTDEKEVDLLIDLTKEKKNVGLLIDFTEERNQVGLLIDLTEEEEGARTSPKINASALYPELAEIFAIQAEEDAKLKLTLPPSEIPTVEASTIQSQPGPDNMEDEFVEDVHKLFTEKSRYRKRRNSFEEVWARYPDAVTEYDLECELAREIGWLNGLLQRVRISRFATTDENNYIVERSEFLRVAGRHMRSDTEMRELISKPISPPAKPINKADEVGPELRYFLQHRELTTWPGIFDLEARKLAARLDAQQESAGATSVAKADIEKDKDVQVPANLEHQVDPPNAATASEAQALSSEDSVQLHQVQQAENVVPTSVPTKQEYVSPLARLLHMKKTEDAQKADTSIMGEDDAAAAEEGEPTVGPDSEKNMSLLVQLLMKK